MKIIHTRLLFWAQGFALCPWLILIHPSRRGDEALIAHERKHCEQQERDGWLAFWWRYLTSPAHRQAYEVEAYRAQIEAGARLSQCAFNLTTMYRLDLTYAQAVQLLS